MSLRVPRLRREHELDWHRVLALHTCLLSLPSGDRERREKERERERYEGGDSEGDLSVTSGSVFILGHSITQSVLRLIWGSLISGVVANVFYSESMYLLDEQQLIRFWP